MSKRSKDRIDYKALSETGERVVKKAVSESEIEGLTLSLEAISMMDSVESLAKKEMLTVVEVSDFLEQQDLEDMETLEEINERITRLSNLQKKYSDIRTELRESIGIENFEQKFFKSSLTVKLLKEEVKKAKSVRKRIKEKEDEIEEKQMLRQEEKERLREEKERKEKEEERKRQEEKEEKERHRQEEKERLREEKERKEKEEERKRQEEKEEKERRRQEEREEKDRLRQEEREERLRKEQLEREDRLREERRKEKEEERAKQEEKERLREEKERKEKEERERGERLMQEENERFSKEQLEREKEQKKERLRDEIDLCICQMNAVTYNFPLDRSNEVEDIKTNIRKLVDHLSHHAYLTKRFKSIAETEELEHDRDLESVKNYIEEGNSKINSLSEEDNVKRKSEEKMKRTASKEEEMLRKEKENRVYVRMLEEVELIEVDMYKIKSVNVVDLDDCELLDREKDLKPLESTLNGLSDKLTNLHKLMPLDYVSKADILDAHSVKEKELRNMCELYKNSIRSEVAGRNLGKDKLVKTENLEINLSKFGGYNSSSDIYTFQSEFEKLYSSSMQKKLLPDYLKNNYLEGQALTLVRNLEDLEEIWSRLKKAFGDTEVLLLNKLKVIEKMGPIWKIRDNQKTVQVLTKLLFAMQELQRLAEKHELENELYYGGGIQKVYNVLGRGYRDKFIRKIHETKLTKKETWDNLMKFIAKEIAIIEDICLLERSSQPENVSSNNFVPRELKDPSNKDFTSGKKSTYNSGVKIEDKAHVRGQENECVLCGKSDHIITRDHFGRQVVQYFTCKKFTELAPKERFKLLFDKKLCFQCLAPGAPVEQGKHKSGTCYSKFTCKHKDHSKYPRKKHVLLCEDHKESTENLELLDRYRKEHILSLNAQLPNFSKNIRLSNHCYSNEVLSKAYEVNSSSDEVKDSSTYMLQTISIKGKRFNLFFDTGCGDLVCKKKAVSELETMGMAELIVPGPIILGGVGDLKTVSNNGVYKVDIPLHSGQLAIMRGVCLDQVTAEFPNYPLKEKVEPDIFSSYKKAGNNPSRLPRLPDSVGGQTDLMLGIKYLKYFPEFVFRLPTGLTIYKSQFVSPDGSRGVVGGPHQVFTEIERQCAKSFITIRTYFTQQIALVRMGYQINPDVQLLSGEKDVIGAQDITETDYKSYSSRIAIKRSKLFEDVETSGTEVTYRCVKCRNCCDCKKSEQVQCISIQEEIEQDIIDKSVKVDTIQGVTIARLPFLENPSVKLCSNKKEAMAVYKSQVRKLDKSPRDKLDVIESERKMQELGFVDKVANLTPSQRELIFSSCLQYFIPWRAVWNPNSLSTPCRLVFDASQVTKSGYSLNSVLAKGKNNMNKLIEILVRWSIHRFGFHTDIRKMYNTVKLSEEDWCYQLYLWHDDLSVTAEPVLKVIKTLIYGVISSGNQAESALRETAKNESANYPRISQIIKKDVYVDDCASGENTWKARSTTTDDLQIVLAKGGFAVKGFTFSGMKPPDNLSDDGKSIKVGGLKWYSEEDTISLKTSDLNFSKKIRGKKTTSISESIPHDFTRRDCVSRLAEVYDPLGKATPITCGMKLDLRILVNRKLDWDDKIPSDLKEIWLANFKTIKNLGDVRFHRAIVPEDAVSLDIDTIDAGDASSHLICSTVHARFLKRDGTHSCQLVLSKSKLVPIGMTLPRAELCAARLNAATGHIVKLSFGDLHKECIKLTDSQITLHWISNTRNPLRQWVRNTVVEINRLADRSLWSYIQSKNMIADIGTRKGASIADISSSSVWLNGLDWMRNDKSDFPVKNVTELKLEMTEIEQIKAESLRPESVDQTIEQGPCIGTNDSVSYQCRKVDQKVLAERYIFSNYVIDPNKFRLRKVIRVLTLVILFIRKLRNRISKTDNAVQVTQQEHNNQQYVVTSGIGSSTRKGKVLKCMPGQVICISDADIKLAYDYYFRKCTEEIKRFADKKSYDSISKEKHGILYYTGRILATQELDSRINLSDVMIDLKSSTFAVPLVDFYSPFAYSIVNEVHWFHPVAKHTGVETVLRYTMKYAYIFGGRELSRRFRKDCVRCRILAKRTVDVAMGPVSEVNLTIAPAFFISQVDLFGPVKSYSLHNKRATISLWFVIFCCSTTGAISIKVMEDYSTSSFLLGFIRFSSCYGYPKKLLPDEGSQLVKGCKGMELNFNDIKHNLNTEYGIDFDTCPVGGHNMHGKVERKIQHVKTAMNKELSNKRLSVMQWETIGDQVANCVNDTPLAVRYVPKDIEHMDLLTPNRLILGRNNDRSPTGPLSVTNDPDKIIKQNAEIMRVWFECWLVCHVPKLMEQPKWFNSDRDTKVGDVVLFLRKEKEFAGNYQYGLVKSVEVGRDQKIRTVIIEYQNHSEQIKRDTRRTVREIVIVHPVDELGIIRELGEIAINADMLAMQENCKT